MTGAIALVPWKNGFFVTDAGLEYPFVIASVAAAIASTGPGFYSLDVLLDLAPGGSRLALAPIVVAGLIVVGTRRLPQKPRSAGRGPRAEAGPEDYESVTSLTSDRYP